MTPSDLRAICNALNDHRNTGGVTRLAALIGMDKSNVRRRLAGTAKITRRDEVAIRDAVRRAPGPRGRNVPASQGS